MYKQGSRNGHICQSCPKLKVFVLNKDWDLGQILFFKRNNFGHFVEIEFLNRHFELVFVLLSLSCTKTTTPV